jgi:hypothetical protein
VVNFGSTGGETSSGPGNTDSKTGKANRSPPSVGSLLEEADRPSSEDGGGQSGSRRPISLLSMDKDMLQSLASGSAGSRQVRGGGAYSQFNRGGRSANEFR